MSGSVVDQACDSRAVLAPNAGSSSIKFALYTLAEDDGEPGVSVRGQITGIGTEPVFNARDAARPLMAEEQVIVAPDHGPALDFLLDRTREQVGGVALSGVGRRVVHGGRSRTEPRVPLHLMHDEGISEAAVTDLLSKRSGVLSVSGTSAEMQQLSVGDDPRAAEAIDLYCLTLVKQTGAMVAVLEGVDAIVFSGGIGEHAVPIRARVCERLQWLGVDAERTANAAGQSRISTAGSRVPVRVVPTDEEPAIARHTVRLLDLVCG